MPELEPSSDNDPATVVRLVPGDIQHAVRISDLLAGPSAVEGSEAEPLPAASQADTRDELLATARLVLNRRRLREHFFSPVLFGEPAWDILLVLYLSDASQAGQTVEQLAEWLKIPQTTALRWVAYLEKEKLVERQAHPITRRAVFIRLQEKGRKAIDEYLSAIPS